MEQSPQTFVSNADLLPALAALEAYKAGNADTVSEEVRQRLERDEMSLRESLGIYVEAVRQEALLGGTVTASIMNIESIREGLLEVEAGLAERASVRGLFTHGPRQWAANRGELRRTRRLQARLG